MPLDRIRPTLGQNLAKLDLCGCKCSLFDLSGAVSFNLLVHRFVSSLGSVALSGPAVSFDDSFIFARWVGPTCVRSVLPYSFRDVSLSVSLIFLSSPSAVDIPPAP
jgi:hypothetical protein